MLGPCATSVPVSLIVEPFAEMDSWKPQSSVMMEILLRAMVALLPVLLRMDSSAAIRVHPAHS
jgi:hypothetical protein